MTSTPNEAQGPALRDVAAHGARVRFLDVGSGPALILVHGYLASRLAWSDVVAPLSDRFRVIVPDLPGFGDSEKPAAAAYAYGLERFADSLADIVAALGLGRVAICGHGMGGAIALTLAAEHAAVVGKLVLLDPWLDAPRIGTLARLTPLPVLGPLVFKQLYGRNMFHRYFREYVYGERIAPLARIDAWFDQFNTPAGREAAYATMLATLDSRALVARLPRIDATTLVVWGRDDRIAPVSLGRRLVREVRRARLEVLECGHSPAEEVPDTFVDVVMSFLERSDERAA